MKMPINFKSKVDGKEIHLPGMTGSYIVNVVGDEYVWLVYCLYIRPSDKNLSDHSRYHLGIRIEMPWEGGYRTPKDDQWGVVRNVFVDWSLPGRGDEFIGGTDQIRIRPKDISTPERYMEWLAETAERIVGKYSM